VNLLSNAVKYGGTPPRVRLRAVESQGAVLLEVTDNGSGFELHSPTRHASLGHAGMRERIRLVGGRLDIQSSLGEGTTIVAWVPIREALS